MYNSDVPRPVQSPACPLLCGQHISDVGSDPRIYGVPLCGASVERHQIALASLQSTARFEYVPSKANPADIPSRVPSQWPTAILRALVVEDRESWREFVQPAMNSLLEPKSAMMSLARMCD